MKISATFHHYELVDIMSSVIQKAYKLPLGSTLIGLPCAAMSIMSL